MHDETSGSRPAGDETGGGEPAGGAGQGSHPDGTGPEWTRRGFIYGTAAAAAGAVLLRRVPRSFRQPADHLTPLVGESGSFSFKQASQGASGTGSVPMTLSAATTAGNLLVATIAGMTSDGSALGPFAPPTTGPTAGDWRLAKSVSGPVGPTGSGRVEIWYLPGTADSPGCPKNVTSVAFTASDPNANCRGALTEFAVPAGSAMMAVLDAVGQGSGPSGGTFSPAVASGNVGNALGVTVAGAFFGGAVNGNWSGMPGWTFIRLLGGNVVNPWGAWYNASLDPVIQSISPTFNVTTENGWASAFAAFRGVVVQGVYLDGAEMATMVALDPTGQELILAGDVEGMWRSADFGNHWQLTQDGLYGAAWRCNASMAWSGTHPGEVYSCVGKNAMANDGGFLVSPDGGVTWSMRAYAGTTPGTYNFLNFQGNSAGAVLPTGLGEKDDQDRSAGHLIAQDPGNKLLYVATYNSGVARSPDDGKTWELIGLWTGDSSKPYGNNYARALAIDPDTPTTLYAGLWQYPAPPAGSPTNGGLWYTTNANYTGAGGPTWTQVAAIPVTGATKYSTVSDLKVLDGNVYVTFTLYGIWLYKPGSGTWHNLNTGLSAAQYTGPWTSLDGYVVSDTVHVIVAACTSGTKPSGQTHYSNVVQTTVNPTTGAVTGTPADLTGSADINTATIPPDDQSWWRAGSHYENWIGGGSFGNAHVLVNPNDVNEIFVTGAGGFYRTTNAGAKWCMAVNGVPAIASFDIATDPNVAQHYVVCGDDFMFIDVAGDNTGFGATVTQFSPPAPADGDNLETHAAIFDPRPSIGVGPTFKSVVYLGVHAKYDTKAGENGDGDIFWSDSTYTKWYDTGFGATPNEGSKAPVGLCVSTDGSSYYLVASTTGAGIWRAEIPADPTGTWMWTRRNDVACTLDSAVVQCMPVVANAAGTHLYCFDRHASQAGGTQTGIWRSTDSGGTWTLIWNLSAWTPSLTVTDPRSGWLAVNPHPLNNGDELWVSTSQGIYKLIGADSGTVEKKTLTPVPMSGGLFPDGSGSVVFTATSATLYAVSLNGPDQTSTQLLSLANGGGPGGWADADAGNSFGSYISWPGPSALSMPLSGKQTLLVGSQPNLAVYTTVKA